MAQRDPRNAFVALTLVGAAGLLIGCGSDPEQPPPAAGGVTVELAKQTGIFKAPKDAVPTAAGETFYVVADAAAGGSGVFRVPISAGGDAVAVATGGALNSPIGIALASDDKKAYVADTKSGSGGAIVVVTLADGALQVLSGTEGSAPTSVTVSAASGSETLYYTGIDAATTDPAVFSVPLDGSAAPTMIVSGAPLVHPSGIAVASEGTIYVADEQATDSTTGKVFSINGGLVEPIVDKVITGQPAGIAMLKDESTLLVSSIDDKTAHDQVLVVALPSYSTSVFNDVIKENTAGAGLHRAANANIFAWADLTAGTAGTVYKVTFK